ncbi:MAG: putative nucleic acid binding AN1-type Zn finger protein [Chlamydiales bacterium]|jgi:predicted nucleic acid binding AN1-type Zn finger protein
MIVGNTAVTSVSILSNKFFLGQSGQNKTQSTSSLGDSNPTISKYMPRDMIVTLLNKATADSAAKGELQASYTTLKLLQLDNQSKDNKMYQAFEEEVTKLTQEVDEIQNSENRASTPTVVNAYSTTDSIKYLKKLGLNLEKGKSTFGSLDAKKFLDSLSRLKKLAEQVNSGYKGKENASQEVIDTIDKVDQSKFRKSIKYLKDLSASLNNFKSNQTEKSLQEFEEIFSDKKAKATVDFVKDTVSGLQKGDLKQALNDTKSYLSGNDLAAFNTSAYYIDQSNRALDKDFFTTSVTEAGSLTVIQDELKDISKKSSNNIATRELDQSHKKIKSLPVSDQSNPSIDSYARTNSSITHTNQTEESTPDFLGAESQKVTLSIESSATTNFSLKSEIKSNSFLSKF